MFEFWKTLKRKTFPQCESVFNPKTAKCPKSPRQGRAIKFPDTTIILQCRTL